MSYAIKQVIAQHLFLGGLVLAITFLFGKSVGLIGLAFVLVDYGSVAFWIYNRNREDKSARGRKLLSHKQAKKRCKRPVGDTGILFGALRIPTESATNHFFIAGATGSGKTLTIRMLLRDQLPLIVKGSKRRAIIYDAKQDMLPVIGSIINLKKPAVSVYVLNPFDQRASAWDMAADVTSPALAQELAQALVPEVDESQPFFTDSVRQLVEAVVIAFIGRVPGKWTFRELLLVVSSKERLRKLLLSDPRTRDIAQNIFDSGDKTVGSIMATVVTKLGRYKAIAAAWEHAKHSISITKWLRKEAIIILGNDERIRSSLDSVNQLFVKIASQHILSQEEGDDESEGLTWLVFDEFREAGELPGLENILLRGRSKRCAVVLGFQDIQGVHHVYGVERGNELVGQCGNKAFLRIESDVTAEWAAKMIGEKEAFEYEKSWSESAQGYTKSESSRKQTRYAVMASEFMTMPVEPRKEGLHGVYLVRSVGAYRATYKPAELNEYVGSLDKTVKAFVSVPVEQQYLEPWNEKDDEKFGFTIEPAAAAQAAPRKPGPPPGPNLNDLGRIGG